MTVFVMLMSVVFLLICLFVVCSFFGFSLLFVWLVVCLFALFLFCFFVVGGGCRYLASSSA